MANSEAIFKVKAALQVTGRQFFLLGDSLSGVIKIGMTANLPSIEGYKKFQLRL
jgi:hypothetical protein